MSDSGRVFGAQVLGAVVLLTAGMVGYLALVVGDGGGAQQRVEGDGPKPDAPPAPKLVDAFQPWGDSGIDFKMSFLTNEQGQTFKINLYDHGCGLAVGDYDGDGHEDVYFLNQLGPNGLFRNRGDGTFENVTEAMGVALDDRICVGATFADYDNDGDQDLFVTSTRGGNVLFRNEENKAFKDVTKEAGVELVGHSQTAAFFDYDNDSLLDLYVVQTAKWTTEEFDEASRYFIGKGGGGSFLPVIKSEKEYNHLYHNNGDGTFTDVTDASGLKGRGWSSDIAVFDYDEDGWQDVFVVCMFGRAQLYRNNQQGAFEEVTKEVLGPTPYGGIGVKVFDYDNDGHQDFYVVDMHSDMWMGLDYEQRSLPKAQESETVKFKSYFGPEDTGSIEIQMEKELLEDVLGFKHDEVIFGNAFYHAQGDGKFKEASDEFGLETFWPWGLANGDFDNDQDEDVFVASGMGYPFYYWKNYLLMNDGKTFVERAGELGVEPPPGGEFLDERIRDVRCTRSSRSAVAADFDGDGRLEVMTNNFNHEPYYFRNAFPKKNYIAFRLQGTRSNRDAIGALVRIPLGEKVLVRQVHAAGGYLSQASRKLHFGLGDQAEVERVEILWPSGERQTLDKPAINQLHDVVEPAPADKKD